PLRQRRRRDDSDGDHEAERVEREREVDPEEVPEEVGEAGVHPERRRTKDERRKGALYSPNASASASKGTCRCSLVSRSRTVAVRAASSSEPTITAWRAR